MRSKILATLAPLLLQAVTVYCASGESRIAKAVKRNNGLHVNGNSSSSGIYRTRFPGVTWDEENWVLSTTEPDQGHYQARGSIANGYMGINVASVGPFFEVDVPVNGDASNGWPLFSRRQTFATIAGFFDSQPTLEDSNFPWLYQYGGDSVISGVPHWSGIILDLGDGVYLDSSVENATIHGFRSTYDFKAGVLSWSYEWTPRGNKGSFKITYRLFANKLNVNQAVVNMEIVPSSDATASIVNVIDGQSAVRTDFVGSGLEDGAIFSSVRPWGVSNITAYVYANVTGSDGLDLSSQRLSKNKPYVGSNDSSIAQEMDVRFTANKPLRITKFVGLASSDAFSDPQQTARQAVLKGIASGSSGSLQSHVAEWAAVMPDHSVDHFTDPKTGMLPNNQYIIDASIMAVVNTYYLLQNTAGRNAINAVSGAPINVDSLSVGGLTSDSYAGQVFWDADVWMQPGLVASHPEAAQRVTNYRANQYPQAIANVETKYTSSRNKTYFDPSAAAYPWTSGRFGNCTGTGPCFDYEYHLNGDIGLSMIHEWVVSGDTQRFRNNHLPIYDSVATLYSNLLERNGSFWTLRNMTDPDEYANQVDAGGFTMPLIAQTLTYANKFRKQFNLETNETWAEMADNILLLRENGVTLEFSSMNGSTMVKQADVVLDTYPLEYTNNYSTTDSLNDLDYYANKQSPDGPAMTWAIFSIVAGEVSPSGCSAYTYAQYSYEPYSRAPFYQLSEQMIDDSNENGGTHPAYPFLTGHGGASQVALFGYLGLRLLPDDVLHINPNLPPQLPHITYRTFYWRGWPISASSNYTHTIISRASNMPSLDTADPRFANRSIPVHIGLGLNATVYRLPVKGPLTVPNRQIGSNNSINGNLIQCRPVTSSSGFEQGQFPIAIVDGATSTKWQPSTANMSSVTVSLADTEANTLISGFHFDWYQSPPVNATVMFHDKVIRDPPMSLKDATGDIRIATTLTNIKQSKPYDPEATDLTEIKIPAGNTTTIELAEPIKAARYATLIISGNQANGNTADGVGATVAEWAILTNDRSRSSTYGNREKRKLRPIDSSDLARRGFSQRRRQFVMGD